LPLAIIVLAAVVAATTLAWRSGNGKESSAPAGADAATLEFAAADIAYVQIRPLMQTVSFSGSLAPLLQSAVKAKIAGEVARIYVREGQAVTQGQVIVELDNPDLRARLDAAIADLEERQARLSIATKNRDTNQALLRRQFISQNAYDQVHSTHQASEAAVRWAHAQVAQARNALNDSAVRSPISGIVARRMVNGGERVAPDMVLLTVVDLSHMELEATVPAADIPGIKVGQAVHFTVDGFSGRRFSGQVARINPVVEAASRAIKLFVAVDNADRALRGGMFAEGEVILSETRPVPVIPVSAVREEAGQAYVFTIEEGKVAKRPVVLGTRDEANAMVEARSGVASGMAVVRVAIGGLKAGTAAIVKAGATPPG
jgi:RND family efflux transporter MFP subunit